MSTGHRQAAAALYSLAASDQDSILAELPDADQRILRDYLAELAALGFDKAANMSEAIPVPAVPAAHPAPAADPAARLRAASAAAVSAVLANEPATLIAQVLALQAWPWSQDLLDTLPPQRRKLVREAGEAGIAPAPARARFLIDALATALPAAPATGNAALNTSRAPARLARWLPWTR